MPGGRPRKKLDTTIADVFGRFRATHETMAAYFECGVRTIEREMAKKEKSEFWRAYEKGRSDFKMRLSEAQAQTALAGNPALLIWLGKQHLGQKDKQEVDTTVSFPDSLKIEYVEPKKKKDG